MLAYILLHNFTRNIVKKCNKRPTNNTFNDNINDLKNIIQKISLKIFYVQYGLNFLAYITLKYVIDIIFFTCLLLLIKSFVIKRSMLKYATYKLSIYNYINLIFIDFCYSVDYDKGTSLLINLEI
ncbi:hypothetical protein BpHYR1_007101 [Brachionus plicatilis]|uniref:Uncharacterized protein n=1 Tax=Brachionus plicatilis TaxID=10195 RepID=A0A3M7SE29_BRAPC|nr:hypothetical protein BpHYR1_007101 [Brachionus plicatilis]